MIEQIFTTAQNGTEIKMKWMLSVLFRTVM